MGGGTGRIPGQDVFHFGFRNCLFGRRDGMFAGTGHFSIHPGFTWDCSGTISPRTICKVSIISSRQSGTECLHDKNCPAFSGIPVERTGTPFCRDKKRPGKYSFHINGRVKYEWYILMARSQETSRPPPIYSWPKTQKVLIIVFPRLTTN